MEENNQYGERYLIAKKRVDDIKGFYRNLASFIIINLVLVFINLYYSPEYLWFYWSLLWWGLGVVFHGLRVFNCFPFLGKDWEEQKIKEFMDKEKSKNEKWQ
jgi:hypothetical protein